MMSADQIAISSGVFNGEVRKMLGGRSEQWQREEVQGEDKEKTK
jgi:hypothetical protein